MRIPLLLLLLVSFSFLSEQNTVQSSISTVSGNERFKKGTGKAFTSFSEFGKPIWVYNYSAGFRYELARAFGMSAGVDFAFYLIFGSAWNK